VAAATIQGFIAVLLWAILAPLTTYAGSIPPFQLAAMTFAIGTLVGLAYARINGERVLLVLRNVPPGAWALGIYGLLMFHACYFFALQNAPPIEVSLIVYLWPLLIVLASGLLPARLGGRGLKWWHVAGAMLAFAGTILILLGAAGRPDFGGSASGYIAAIAAALIWCGYRQLRCDGRRLGSSAFGIRDDRMAGKSERVGSYRLSWPRSGRARILCVGSRDETRQYSTARCRFLRNATAVDHRDGSPWPWHRNGHAVDFSRTRDGGRAHRRLGYDQRLSLRNRAQRRLNSTGVTPAERDQPSSHCALVSGTSGALGGISTESDARGDITDGGGAFSSRGRLGVPIAPPGVPE
jgi:EamA-like transporter family